jgi:hypothetical protein
MQIPNRVYVVCLTRVAVTGAITLIQIAAGATVPLQILRAKVSQSSSTTSTQISIQINRKSAAATVTSFTPLKCGPVTDPAAAAVGGTALTGTNATVEGTDGNVLVPDDFNYLNGWTWVPTYDERLFVDALGIIALKFPVAPGSSVTVTASVFFRELG